MDLKELEERALAARRSLGEWQLAEYEDKSERERKMREELEAKFGERRRELTMAVSLAEAAVTAENERLALARTDYKYPPGTEMTEWETPHYYGRNAPPKQETGQRGVIEIITAESKHPDNLSSYSRAKRGDLVIRLKKKDGSLGSRYITRSWAMERWFPVGVDPNKIKKEEAA